MLVRPRSVLVSAMTAFIAAAVGCTTPTPPADVNDAGSDASDITAPPDSLVADVGGDAPPASDVRDASVCATDARPEYPAGPYEINDNTILPNLHFAGLDARGVSFGDFYDPCTAPARLLVIRNLAAWAGTARWHAEHTGRLL